MGIYTRAEAARLLDLSPARVGSWVRGYRYTWGPKERRKHGRQPAVIQTDLPVFDNSLAISFLELMELRVIKRFREEGVPLQTVRKTWEHAAQAFDSKHPFADRRVFLDRGRIFMALDIKADLLLEISSRKRPFQVIAGPIFVDSLTEVEFDKRTHLVREWWPRGKAVPIVLNPNVAFGAPVVAETRVPTSALAAFSTTRRVEDVAELFELPVAQVRAALDYESLLARAA